MASNGRITITEVAKIVGVSTKTIMRWELTGKVSKARRDWRGWRVYERDAVRELIMFHEYINDPENPRPRVLKPNSQEAGKI